MKRIIFLDYVRIFACFLVIVVHPSYTRRNSFHPRDRNRMGFLHNKLCAPYNRYIPSFYMYKSVEGSKAYTGNV